MACQRLIWGLTPIPPITPFVMFHDSTLRAIAERSPQSARDLEGIAVTGIKKLEACGAEVRRVCQLCQKSGLIAK